MKTRVPLAYQILAFQVGIIILSALAGAFAAIWQARQELDRQYEQRSLAIAESVASSTAIQQAVLAGDRSGTVQQAAEAVRHSTGATYVVVTDRQGIRFSHPTPSLIGRPVDENPGTVLAGNNWVGVQNGTLGFSARGKAPILYQGKVIGMVSVGFLVDTVYAQLFGEIPSFAVTLLLALRSERAVRWSLPRGSRGRRSGSSRTRSRACSRSGRRASRASTRAPSRPTATAPSRSPTTRRDGCSACLPTVVGRKVSQVLPAGRLLKFLTGGLNDQDEVLLAGDRVLVASRRAIRVRGQEIGHVATLRDSTELAGLSRGLGIDSLTDALRAQAHEFSNRLHTIAGLVELGRGEEAMKLIAQTSGVHQELSEALLDRLGDPVLGALLLAKAATASERGIELRVPEDLVLTTGTLDAESLITLLGNLIDNGLDAAASATGDRWVAVSVSMQDGDLVLQVRDSGPGVAEGLAEQIFQEGFSTKSRAGRRRRGFGLALALQVARRNGGDITVVNEGGAVFTARIPARVAAVAP